MKRRAQKQYRKEQDEIFRRLYEIKDRLGAAKRNFNAVSDPDLVDACVHEISCLMAQYSYYLRQAQHNRLRFEEAAERSGT